MLRVQGDILVTTSKGENLKLKKVTKIMGFGKAIVIEHLTVPEENELDKPSFMEFDKFLFTDRSIDLINSEVEDIGF